MLPPDDRWAWAEAAVLALLLLLALVAAAALTYALGSLVWATRIPPWLHRSVEFVGWWFLLGLIVGAIWARVLSALRARGWR